jgi:hypothetical protein
MSSPQSHSSVTVFTFFKDKVKRSYKCEKEADGMTPWWVLREHPFQARKSWWVVELRVKPADIENNDMSASISSSGRNFRPVVFWKITDFLLDIA